MTISKVYTIKQVADELHVTPATVNRWISNKELKAQKLGKSWRIQEEDLKAFIAGSVESVSKGIVNVFSDGLFSISKDDAKEVQNQFMSLFGPLVSLQFPLDLKLDESLSIADKLNQLRRVEERLLDARKASWHLLETYSNFLTDIGNGLHDIDKKRQSILKEQKRGLRSSRSNTKNVNRAKKGGAK